MSVNSGVWIDHRQAILVRLSDASPDITRFTSDIADSGRSSLKNAHTSHDYAPEDTLERKFESELKSFYDEVIVGLQGTTSLFIMGPGEAKGEFHKRLDAKKISGLLVEVKPADKMTEGQLVAKIVEHFAAAAGNHGSSKAP